MTKDLIALDDLINKAVNKESELEQTSKELAQRDKQFAQYLKQKKLLKSIICLWTKGFLHLLIGASIYVSDTTTRQ